MPGWPARSNSIATTRRCGAQRGEVLLSRGQVDEAVEHLRKALALKADERTRQLLADAVAEGLEADFPRYRKLAEQLAPALNQTERRAEYVRRLARGLLEAGEAKQAFDAYVSLLDGPGLDSLDRLETAREVRRDRWLTAGLNEAWQAADGEVRKAIDAAVAKRLEGAGLAKSLAFFTWHPAATPARLRMAEQLAKQGATLAAEQQLWQVIEEGDARARRRRGANGRAAWRPRSERMKRCASMRRSATSMPTTFA